MEFKGKVCIITGSASRFGRATAVHLASLGCCVSITDKNEDSLSDTKKMCVDAGLCESEVLMTTADLMYDNEIESIVKNTVDHFKRIDFTVNSAAVLHYDKVDDSMDKYKQVLQVNQCSIIYMNQLAIPYLEKTRGAIVNISSVAGLRPVKGMLAYAMSKAALDQYTRIMSLELSEKGIRVNSVNTGPSLTNIFTSAGYPQSLNDKFCEHAITMNLLDRVLEPDEVARVIAFLLSSKSSSTTGTCFMLDGGYVNMFLNNGHPGKFFLTTIQKHIENEHT